MNKKLLSVLIYLFLLFPAFSQKSFASQEINLEDKLPDSVAVLGGTVLCQPVKTSYGYVAVGESRQIYAFTPHGKLLWQRRFHSNMKPFVSVAAEDMLYIVSKDSKISMMNSSGCVLWTSKAGFNVVEAPLPGLDGRVYVRGSKNIACFGLNGVCRWKVSTELQNEKIKLQTLNDGSVLFFLGTSREGKSVARRIDPFGNLSEEIVFAGNVLFAESCKDGVVLSFSDGAVGLCAANRNGAYSKWVISSSENALCAPVKILTDSPDSKIALIYGSPAKVVYINSFNGKETKRFDTEISKIELITNYCHTSQGLFLSDGKHSWCYRQSGDIAWKCRFDPKKNWYFNYATDAGFMCFCLGNWSFEVYQMRLNIGSTESSYKEKTVKMYDFYSTENVPQSTEFYGRAITQDLADKMRKAFKAGNFGQNEAEWTSLLIAEFDRMYFELTASQNNSHEEHSFFRKNAEYIEDILTLSSETGIYFRTRQIANLIRKTDDPTILLTLVKCAGKIGYDPEGSMISSLEYLIQQKGKKDENLLKAIADSTFEICRFMGRPLFIEKGKGIISYMLYPQFDKKTKDYARVILEKIIKTDF